jgi:tRNA G18 (ribose-2'-O)-methylase SpoU
MNIVRVTGLEASELRPYRTLRRPVEHQRQGIFVAEGEKVVRRLLESRLETLSVLMTPEWLRLYQPLLEARNMLVFIADKKHVEAIVGFHLHQGIMAVARIPDPGRLEDVLAAGTRPHLLVAVDGLANAENLGVLVRNCAAFGVGAFLVGETSSSPYLRRAVRNSMGTIFNLPVVHAANLAGTLEQLRATHGIRILAAHPHAQEKRLQQAPLADDCCLVFGSEGEGVSPEVLDVCDERVAIAMKEGVDSLNVASASAVFLYEAQRQRALKAQERPGSGGAS